MLSAIVVWGACEMSESGMQKLAFFLLVALTLYVAFTGGGM